MVIQKNGQISTIKLRSHSPAGPRGSFKRRVFRTRATAEDGSVCGADRFSRPVKGVTKSALAGTSAHDASRCGPGSTSSESDHGSVGSPAA